MLEFLKCLGYAALVFVAFASVMTPLALMTYYLSKHCSLWIALAFIATTCIVIMAALTFCGA